MIFTLISETQEFLNEAVEKEKNSQEEERQRKLKEAEEAELVSEISYEWNNLLSSQFSLHFNGYSFLKAKLTGTPVTHENFIIWKLKFDEEQKTDEVKIEIKNKLTGLMLNSIKENGRMTINLFISVQI